MWLLEEKAYSPGDYSPSRKNSDKRPETTEHETSLSAERKTSLSFVSFIQGAGGILL